MLGAKEPRLSFDKLMGIMNESQARIKGQLDAYDVASSLLLKKFIISSAEKYRGLLAVFLEKYGGGVDVCQGCGQTGVEWGGYIPECPRCGSIELRRHEQAGVFLNYYHVNHQWVMGVLGKLAEEEGGKE
jgi:hypothetical protein